MRALRLKSGTKNKYGAETTAVDNIKFDSKAEARRYGELKLLERAREIFDLQIHPRYKIFISSHFICDVELDFAYIDRRDGRRHHEDVKGKDTPMSKLKRKMVEAAHNIKVEIIK